MGDVIRLSGDLTLDTWPSMWSRLRESLEAREGDVSINIDGLSYLDGLGLNLLLSAWRLIAGRGARMQIICCDSRRQRLLQKLGLDRYFTLTCQTLQPQA
ncbi:MAG: STAS domain-containing protein [Candidatus Xenobia bacterium]